ncbi:FtsW/RodA/SpoVE family cell cycle protein [Sulfuriroseicoccus oceanibius]|uniref:Probable peptidoglycan glycosyltransferase FtsW n=1 Tax=Sulfuriroseicoccus oceanibius TaxID=2707525 RepID=A0A6B3LE78_9BACT|nr:putative peptidoglycan glycosyltransferase FtsW [Sulfuriroseicoccus oceanibius]QQL44698.1 cell division protein FtsW [Sulfuriroseicoccus oceanibius]
MNRKYSLYLLIFAMVILISIGLVMLASTSAYATDGMAQNYKGLRQQGMWLGLGIGVCVVMAMIDYHQLKRWFWPIFIGTCVLLALCYVPGIGREINGERRWIDAGLVGLSWLRFQPSELGKVVTIIAVAFYFDRLAEMNGNLMKNAKPLEKKFLPGFVYPGVLAAVPALLILFEKDLGSAATLFAVVLAMLFIAGSNWFWLSSVFVAGAGALAAMVIMIPNRARRFLAIADLEAFKADEGLQQWRALLALGSGGVWGLGLGNGREKMFYMPYAHTDFIFPMIGEELGAIGTLSVVFMFVLFTVAAFAIAMNAPDRFGMLLGSGIAALIAIEAALNIGVTTATLPNTGLPLPFVSYGGSSMLCTLMAVGILINIYRQGIDPTEPDPKKVTVRRKRVTPRV